MKELQESDFRVEASWDGYMLMYRNEALHGEGSMRGPATQERIDYYRKLGERKQASIIAGHTTLTIEQRIKEIGGK